MSDDLETQRKNLGTFRKAAKSMEAIMKVHDKLQADYGSAMTYLSDPYGVCIHWHKDNGDNATLNLVIAKNHGIRIEFTDNLVNKPEAFHKQNSTKVTLHGISYILFYSPAIHLLHGSFDSNEPATEANLTYLVETLLRENWPS